MCNFPMFRITDFWKIGTKQAVFFAPFKEEKQVRELYKYPRYTTQLIPCGNCIECRIEYSKQWAFRCMKEANQYENNVMITLTYDNEHLPITKIDENGEVKATLVKKHHQDFMKRLRKAFEPQKIRFYMCGEYGEKRDRPHYHIICFNLKIDDLKFKEWSFCDWSKEKNPLYESKKITNIWKQGRVILNEVNYETCAYVARYVTKKIKGVESAEYYENRGQLPEYTCMSRRPGIGEKFYEDNKDKIRNGEKIWQKTKKKVIEVKPGRYFDKLLEKDDPEALQKLKNQRLENSKIILENILSQTSKNVDEYREVKEALNTKYNKLKRQLT